MAEKKEEKEAKVKGADKEMSVHERLNFIQQHLKAPKGQHNNFGNYNYRSCEDIMEAVKPLLGECTLVVTDKVVHFKSDRDPLVIKVTDSKGNQFDEIVGGDRFYIEATARLSKSKDEYVDGVAYAREADNKRGMDESQVTGATSSYARKYALNGLFAIDDTKDADTMDNTQTNTRNVQTPQDGQKALMEQFGMNPDQKSPVCTNCGAKMSLVPRKDGSNLFWSCPNWRSKGCKYTLNVDDVDMDGNVISTKKARPVTPQQPANQVPAENDPPF